MDTNEQIDEASRIAVHTAKNAQQAVEHARQVQLEAMFSSDKFTNTIEDAVVRAFKAGIGEGRYIDVTRIPLICQSIVNIDSSIDDMNQKIDDKLVTKDQFWPVRTLVYGMVGALLTGMVGAFLMLVLKLKV